MAKKTLENSEVNEEITEGEDLTSMLKDAKPLDEEVNKEAAKVEEMDDEDEEDMDVPEVEIDVPEDIKHEMPAGDTAKAVDNLDSMIDAQIKTKKASPRYRQVKGLPEDIASGNLVERASRKVKAKKYKQEEKVFKEEEDKTQLKSEGELRKETYLKLVQSAKSKTILEGTLYSCIQSNGKVLAQVSFGYDSTVYIPVEYLFAFDPTSVRPREDEKREVAELNAKAYYTSLRYGMLVKFVVLKVFEQDALNPEAGAMAYGSRIDAMATMSKMYYVNPTADGKPSLIEGLRAEAVVTYITRKGIGVEVFGAETFIPAHELSWRRIGDVRTDDNDYHVGQHIEVKITKITPLEYQAYGRSFHLIDLQVSVRQTQANPNKKFFGSFVVNQECSAEVTQITDDGIFVFMGGKRDALCEFPRNLPIPPIGSIVKVKIHNKEEGTLEKDETKKWRIYATIKGIIRMGKSN